MLFLAILMLLNGVLDNNTFVNLYRLDIGGLPINIVDAAMIICLIVALFRRRRSASFQPTDRAHPVFSWLIVLYLIAFIIALIGGVFNQAPFRAVATSARNFLALPIGIYAGYFLTSNLKSSTRFTYISIVVGLAVSVTILLFFKEMGETLTSTEAVSNIRPTQFVSTYAGLAAALLIYTIASGDRMFRLPLSVAFMGICLIGQFYTLSRSDWIAAFGAMVMMYFLLPKGRRGGNIVAALVAIPVLVACMWIGLYFGSQVTGKNMFQKMYTRVESLLPGDHPGVKSKAWDTRLPGLKYELSMFLHHPLTGGGIAVQDSPEMPEARFVGVRHTTWISVGAETGILGVVACVLVVASMIVIGKRMVRDRFDKGSVLVGAVSAAGGVYFILNGAATMSFNQLRWGLPMTILCGVALRTRSMQLTQMRLAAEGQQLQEWAQFETEAPYDAGYGEEIYIPATGYSRAQQN